MCKGMDPPPVTMQVVRTMLCPASRTENGKVKLIRLCGAAGACLYVCMCVRTCIPFLVRKLTVLLGRLLVPRSLSDVMQFTAGQESTRLPQGQSTQLVQWAEGRLGGRGAPAVLPLKPARTDCNSQSMRQQRQKAW